MLEFFMNYGGSVAVGLIVLAVIVLIIVGSIKNKRAGKHSCGGNCSCCGACSQHGCSGSERIDRVPKNNRSSHKTV